MEHHRGRPIQDFLYDDALRRSYKNNFTHSNFPASNREEGSAANKLYAAKKLIREYCIALEGLKLNCLPRAMKKE